MTPWQIRDRIILEDADAVLKSLPEDDPFWVGASYGVDPFVGMIYRLPLRDPPYWGRGVPAMLFDKIAKEIISGNLHGDPLALMVEKFSKACTEPEWLNWYRPILQGDLVLPIDLALYNKYAPHRIQPPAMNKPKNVGFDPVPDLPPRYFIQPLYDEGFCFWFLYSMAEPIEVRGYDENIRRIRNPAIETCFQKIGIKHPLDVVITGYLNNDEFVAEDLILRQQFTQESATPPLYKRLMAAAHIGLPLVQMSDEFSGKAALSETFWKELHLAHQQGYKSVVFRDLDGKYPFRNQPDQQIMKSKFTKIIRSAAS